MKKYVLNALFAFAAVASFGQNNLVAVENLDDKWGFVNSKGEVVIACQYIDAHSFTSGGVAMVQEVSKKWKLIDAKGNTVNVPLKEFQPKSYAFFTRGFKGDMLLIVSNKKYGYLNAAGTLVIPAEYDELSEFRGDYAIGKIGTSYYIVSKNGDKTQVEAPAEDMKYLVNGYGIYRSKKMFGYVDVHGKVVIEAQFKRCGYFEGGVAWAADATTGKIGLINTKGEWVVQPQYTSASDPDPIHHICQVKNEAGTVSFIKNDGTPVPVSGATDLGEFHEGFAWAKSGALVGLVDHTGKWVIEAKYTKVENMVEGLVTVRDATFFGACDKSGKVVIPLEYERVENLCDGLIRVRKNGKWGYVDKTGNVVIAPQFDGAEDFQNGFAQAKLGTTWGLIDKSGNFVIPATYKRVKELEVF